MLLLQEMTKGDILFHQTRILVFSTVSEMRYFSIEIIGKYSIMCNHIRFASCGLDVLSKDLPMSTISQDLWYPTRLGFLMVDREHKQSTCPRTSWSAKQNFK